MKKETNTHSNTHIHRKLATLAIHIIAVIALRDVVVAFIVKNSIYRCFNHLPAIVARSHLIAALYLCIVFHELLICLPANFSLIFLCNFIFFLVFNIIILLSWLFFLGCIVRLEKLK